MNRQLPHSLALIAGLALCVGGLACARPKTKPAGLTGRPLPVPPSTSTPREEKPREHEPVDGLAIPFSSNRKRTAPTSAEPSESEEPEDSEEVTIE